MKLKTLVFCFKKIRLFNNRGGNLHLIDQSVDWAVRYNFNLVIFIQNYILIKFCYLFVKYSKV